MLRDVQSMFHLRPIHVHIAYISCLLKHAAVILIRATGVAGSKFSLSKRDVTESIGIYIGCFLSSVRGCYYNLLINAS